MVRRGCRPAPPGRQRRTLCSPGPGDTPADLPPDPPFPTPSPQPTRAPRGRARPAVLAACCSLPRRTTPVDLHLGRANSGDAPPAGWPEEGHAATQRDPPRPTGAPPTSQGHTRMCPARPPTPRPLQTGGRSLRTCPPAAIHALTTRVAREDCRGAPVQGVNGDEGEGDRDEEGAAPGGTESTQRRGRRRSNDTRCVGFCVC